MGRIITKNGKKYVEYTIDGEKHTLRYKENVKHKSKVTPVRVVVASFILAALTLLKTEIEYPGIIPHSLVVSDLTLDDVKERIYSSENLTDEEKNYLYNEDYFNDILPYINDSLLSRCYVDEHLKKINISNYSDTSKVLRDSTGYYTLAHPHTLFVRDYENMDDYNSDVVAHEFIHLCQVPVKREIIIEASAELISNEYYDYCYIDSYSNEVKLLKILMEIIGPEPILSYNFAGDFSKIEENVKPYLSEDDYQKFLLIRTYNTDSLTHSKDCLDIYSSLEKLYKAKYNKDMSKNEIITCIRNSKPINRYYFNKKSITQDDSYYLNRELQITTIYDAYRNGDIYFCMMLNDVIPYERVIDLLDSDEFNGVIYGYTDDGFEIYDTIDQVIQDKDKVKFYLVKGNKKVSYESFIKNNKMLNPYSRYKIFSKHGFVSLLDRDGAIQYYKNVKKYIPTIEETVNNKQERKLVKKIKV